MGPAMVFFHGNVPWLDPEYQHSHGFANKMTDFAQQNLTFYLFELLTLRRKYHKPNSTASY